MQALVQHSVKSKSLIYPPQQAHVVTSSKTLKRDWIIANAFSKSVRLNESRQVEIINRIKVHHMESETYAKLHDEYLNLYKMKDNIDISPFL